MSFKDLNDNIKQKIYEYDNTYHEIFNKVLYEIKPYFDKKYIHHIINVSVGDVMKTTQYHD